MKKHKWLILLLHMALFFLLGLFVFAKSDEITVLKGRLYEQIALYTQPEIAPLREKYDPIDHREDAWYLDVRTIRHAGGGIDGLDYTNSAEALAASLACGENYVEVDFIYTADGELVCVHEWEDVAGSGQALTLQAFEHAKIWGKYTPMTAEDVLEQMRRNDTLHIVIDTKENDLPRVVQTLMDLCGGDSAVMDRFIIQLYDRGLKAELETLYPFAREAFLFTCYKFGANRWDEIMALCYEEDIPVVTVPQDAWSTEVAELFREKGFVLYEHTLNRPDEARAALERGFHGVYTDFLLAEDLQ